MMHEERVFLAAQALHRLMPGCEHDEHGADCRELAEAAVTAIEARDLDPRDDGLRSKIAATQQMSCGHDVTGRCDYCNENERALRVELAAVYHDHIAARGTVRTLMRDHRDCDQSKS